MMEKFQEGEKCTLISCVNEFHVQIWTLIPISYTFFLNPLKVPSNPKTFYDMLFIV